MQPEETQEIRPLFLIHHRIRYEVICNKFSFLQFEYFYGRILGYIHLNEQNTNNILFI